MKRKSLILAVVLLLPAWLNAQNLDDALRYSQQFYQGTARFSAMGGAFTALGGDLTSIMVNPASAGIFRASEFTITPQLSFRNISTNYMESTIESQTSNFGLGQIGFVVPVSLGSKSGLSGISLAYTYNMTNNFNKSFTINGISDDSSIADYFASRADGTNTWNLAESSSLGYMGYYTYLTDTVSGSFTDYSSIFSYYDEQEYAYGQRTIREVDNLGTSGEHNIAMSANWGDKLFLGASIGLSSVNYTGHYYHTEADENSVIPYFKDLSYTDHFEADGTGWNFKLGLIFLPVEILRLGLSFQTPTIYRISEVYYSSLTASYDEDMNDTDEGGFNFDIQRDFMSYDYRVTTPYRINAGAAVQIGTMATISADYEYIDYASASLSRGSDGYDFTAENQDLRNELKSSSNLRLGAEVRLGPAYLRGGYRHYGSAFQKGSLNEDLVYNSLSAGVGYRQKSFYFDLAFSGLLSQESYMMYPDIPVGLSPASIDNRDKILTATLGLRF